MSSSSPSRPILTLSNDMALVKFMQKTLSPLGFELLLVNRSRDFLIHLKRDRYLLSIVDTAYPGVPPDELLKAIQRVAPHAGVIAIVPPSNLPFCLEALEHGATDVMSLPLEPVQLKFRVAGHYNRLARATSTETSTTAPLSSSGSNVTPLSRANIPLDLSTVRELSDFLQLSLREFIELERTILDLKNRLAEVSGVRADIPLETEQSVLLVDPDPEFGALLGELCATRGIAFHHAFTGGEALDRAGLQPVDILICVPDLPDLEGQVIVNSLKSELPYIDALLLREWGKPSAVAVWFNDSDVGFTSMPARNRTDIDALLNILTAHRNRREQDKHLSLVFKDKHRDYMRAYSAMREKLRDALMRLRRR